MVSFLQKLTYFNLVVGIIDFAISKSNHVAWPILGLLLFPLLFNWQILQKLKLQKLGLQQFDLGIWQYLFGALTIIYVLTLIYTGTSLLALTSGNRIGIFFAGKDIGFAITLTIHFIFALRMKSIQSKIKQVNR
jgi:prepilin signal peptidase PulO-like enzyme (type II secretory pathway)